MAERDKEYLRIVIQGIGYIGQLGFSIAVPILLWLWLGMWLHSAFFMGAWVIMVCILGGLFSAFCSFRGFCRVMMRKNTKKRSAQTDSVTQVGSHSEAERVMDKHSVTIGKEGLSHTDED